MQLTPCTSASELQPQTGPSSNRPAKLFGILVSQFRRKIGEWHSGQRLHAQPRYDPFKMAIPEVTLTHLNRADGSATYTHNGYSIIGAVNGPVEVQRRDEQPEEATIEVNVRPAFGVGSMYPPSLSACVSVA